MDEYEPMGISRPAENLLKSVRSEKTREYYLLILNALKDGFKIDDTGNISGGPVRAKDLQSSCVGEDKIPHTAAFYRLLKRLIEAGIVSEVNNPDAPIEPGPKPKYYLLVDGLAPRYLESREMVLNHAIAIESQLDEYQKELDACKGRLSECYRLMRENGISNPEEVIKKRLQN